MKQGASIKDLLSNGEENLGGTVYNLNKFTFNPGDALIKQRVIDTFDLDAMLVNSSIKESQPDLRS